ncbi:MAG: glutamate racemase [Rikenellaceae bacterium]|jgi:glutamate racemase|nr:glutamate racemase [Rikenellaceae bacterium]
MNNSAIGIFDSGMGGLSVRAEIARRLPNESLIYFGDGKNVPYGSRSKEDIIGFASEAVEFLLSKGVKMVVVACNAATAAAIDHLRAKYDIPIIGMEPAVKPAALASKRGAIGVLATAAALRGELFRATAAKYSEQVKIVETVGEGFVELVEDDLEDTPEAFQVVKTALEPMLEKGVDHIVLGCTHYPFLIRQIRQVVGERDVVIVDSAPAIARRVDQLLTEYNLHADEGHLPEYEFHTFAGEQYRQRLVAKSSKT